jgi:DNA cross-link repair 1A protein
MAGSYAKKATTPSKSSFGSKQSSTKRNTSILSFFQKTETPPGAVSRQPRITHFATPSTRSPSNGRGTPTFKRGISLSTEANGDLFLEDKKGLAKIQQAKEGGEKARSPTPDIWGDDEEFLKPDDEKYNESGSAAKRRKVESPITSADEEQKTDAEPTSTKLPVPTKTRSGPFIDESDNEDDLEAFREIQGTASATTDVAHDESLPTDKTADNERLSEPTTPPMVRAATNNADHDEHANFDDLEEEDELIAEETRNRPWETEEHDQQIDLDIDPDNETNDCSGIEETAEEDVSTCPICQTALKDLNVTVSCHSSYWVCASAHAQYRKFPCMSMTALMEVPTPP